MTLPTAQEITNWYLCGQQTTPANKISDSLIRPKDKAPSIEVSLYDFMTTGAGRFARISEFERLN